MNAQIDALRGDSGESDGAAQNFRARADGGDDAAVVRGIARAMDDARAFPRYGGRTRIHEIGVAPFRDIRNDLE